MLYEKKQMKGQISFVNLFGALIITIIYCAVFVPILQPVINTCVAGLDVTWQFYAMTVTLLQLIPLFLLIVMLLGFLSWAQPKYG